MERKKSTKKYSIRPSPPFPANDYCGRMKKGNDGQMYISSRVGSQKACTWKPVVRASPRSSHKSPMRSSHLLFVTPCGGE